MSYASLSLIIFFRERIYLSRDSIVCSRWTFTFFSKQSSLSNFSLVLAASIFVFSWSFSSVFFSLSIATLILSYLLSRSYRICLFLRAASLTSLLCCVFVSFNYSSIPFTFSLKIFWCSFFTSAIWRVCNFSMLLILVSYWLIKVAFSCSSSKRDLSLRFVSYS